MLNQVLTSGGNTVIRGTFNSLPNTTFTLEFYSSAVKDPSNFGEGETYIGSANVATDGFGDATINVTLAGDLTGRFITATATNLTTGDTSEFSAAQQATAAPATSIAFSVQPSNTVAGNIITPAVAVSLLDEFGNVVTSTTNAVTLALGANPGGGTLSGTTTRSAVNGVATFNDLSIDKAGNGYTLHATVSGLGETNSNAFDVVSNEATLPTLTDPQVNPNNLTKDGGTVTLSVEATDNAQLQSVWAEVTKPDGSKQTVNLTRQSGNTYTGTFNAPANSTCDPQTYKVVFFARDDAGNQGGPTSELQFTVAENTTPFSLARATLNVTNLPNTGGAVLITANLTGCQGVVSLVATVTTGKGRKSTTVATIILTKQTETVYTGTFNAPANNTKKDISYRITVSLNNGTPITAGTVTVAKKGRKPQSVLDNDEEDALKIGAGSPLRLRLLSAHNGSAATVFTFTLNKAAAVTARILSPTGKAVRQFGLRQATVGLNSLVWDGKAQTGGSVSRGVYLIEILAQDETGQMARAAQTVVVK